MTRHASLAAAFAHAKSENRAALIGYLPAGFPNAADSVRLINQMVESGCDIIEVGLPYSDPLMDGPAIQEAVDIALRGGTTPETAPAAFAPTLAPPESTLRNMALARVAFSRLAADLA